MNKTFKDQELRILMMNIQAAIKEKCPAKMTLIRIGKALEPALAKSEDARKELMDQIFIFGEDGNPLKAEKGQEQIEGFQINCPKDEANKLLEELNETEYEVTVPKMNPNLTVHINGLKMTLDEYMDSSPDVPPALIYVYSTLT